MNSDSVSQVAESVSVVSSGTQTRLTKAVRLLGWCILALMLVFVVNNFLSFGAGLPGAGSAFSEKGGSALGWMQFAFYPIAIIAAGLHISKSSHTTLRADSDKITSINTFLVRAAFWVVLLVGLVDMVISFMRIEDVLQLVVGDQLAKDLGRSHFRGPYVHMPVMALGIIVAMFTRTLGFHWLTLLIVAAELLIVFSRFIFSYEQAFFSDLVRFWYGALFLFASAYTLLEEGHVRVDVFYAGFSDKTKGKINVAGSLFMGIVFCWTILFVGMGGKASIINAPIFNFETTQSGFGLYVKYMMAGFLGFFAITMMIQFVSYMFGSVADIRGDPGKRVIAQPAEH
ncbi:MAG: permease [Hyphomicrobiales bacterium]|nr:MAG: permease [Hyphomicrobiales bacterium]